MDLALTGWACRSGDILPCIRGLSSCDGTILGYRVVARYDRSVKADDYLLLTGALFPGIALYLTYFYPRRMIQTR